VGALAHALENAGLATVGISLIREHAQKLRAPRMLHCPFPLGRPLGRPGDPAFQRRVLLAAFALLPRPSGPILEDFPEAIADEAEQPLACPLPSRFDPSAPRAVDEARGLRPAWERARARNGGTQLGRLVEVDEIPAEAAAFCRIDAGVPWPEAGLPGDPATVAMDIRIYYEEAALALSDHVPAARAAARAAESWFYQRTQMGALLRRVQARLREATPPYPGWLYLLPMTQTSSA
jgi:hypothetical protein